MDEYVERLVEDLQNTGRANRGLQPGNAETRRAYVAEAGGGKTLAEITGVEPTVFPAREKLTDAQAEKLARAVLALWKQHGVEADYPADFPLARLYPLLLVKFSEKIPHFGGGSAHVEFCDYDPEHCPFGRRYCQVCWDNDPLLAE